MFSLYFYFRACVGLPPINHMLLEHKIPQLMKQFSPLPVAMVTPAPAKLPADIPIESVLSSGSVMTNGVNGHY